MQDLIGKITWTYNGPSEVIIYDAYSGEVCDNVSLPGYVRHLGDREVERYLVEGEGYTVALPIE